MIKYLPLILLIFTATVTADDLDDGIGIDEPITDDLNLDKNVQFIVRNALSKGNSNQADSTGTCGSGNIVIGAGSNVQEVINISSNTGTTAVCGN